MLSISCNGFDKEIKTSMQNPGYVNWQELLKTSVNLPCLTKISSGYKPKRISSNDLSKVVLALQCTDLTTLAGDDTYSNVSRLCYMAVNPVKENLNNTLGFEHKLKVAAVCVYPAMVKYAVSSLQKFHAVDIKIAAVATGFPTGQYGLSSKLDEIRFAVAHGANEIDIVLSRELVLTHSWQGMYEEVKACREACGDNVEMKTILSIGELGSLENIYAASIVALCAGSDFIKTSTGKEAVNAYLPAGIVMARAIKVYYELTGFRAGLKPAGGLRTVEDAVSWINLVEGILGTDWLTPELFRIGASTLLKNVTKKLETLVKRDRSV